MKLFNTLVAVVLVSIPLPAFVEGAPFAFGAKLEQSVQGGAGELVTIRMKDGSVLVARVVDDAGGRLKIVTAGGLSMEIPQKAVEKIEKGKSLEVAGRVSDSNNTRLLFSPSGRPLPKGEGYFSDHLLVLPGVAYGLTDNLSLSAGASVIPGLGLDEQLLYVSPRFGKQFSERFSASAGILYAHAGEDGDEGNLGVGFAIGAFGKPDKSLSLGAGVTRTVEREYSGHYVNGVWQGQTRSRVSHTPVIMVGGTARLSNRVALVSENWLVLDDGFKLSDQPFALGVRFLGDRLTADVGFVVSGELIDEGFPLPWVSVSYHFGKRR